MKNAVSTFHGDCIMRISENVERRFENLCVEQGIKEQSVLLVRWDYPLHSYPMLVNGQLKSTQKITLSDKGSLCTLFCL